MNLSHQKLLAESLAIREEARQLRQRLQHTCGEFATARAKLIHQIQAIRTVTQHETPRQTR